MDAWSGDQLKKMQLGGNDALNTFLIKYSVDKFTDIKEKYNSQAAEVGTGTSEPILRGNGRFIMRGCGLSAWLVVSKRGPDGRVSCFAVLPRED